MGTVASRTGVLAALSAALEVEHVLSATPTATVQDLSNAQAAMFVSSASMTTLAVGQPRTVFPTLVRSAAPVPMTVKTGMNATVTTTNVLHLGTVCALALLETVVVVPFATSTRVFNATLAIRAHLMVMPVTALSLVIVALVSRPTPVVTVGLALQTVPTVLGQVVWSALRTVTAPPLELFTVTLEIKPARSALRTVIALMMATPALEPSLAPATRV